MRRISLLLFFFLNLPLGEYAFGQPVNNITAIQTIYPGIRIPLGVPSMVQAEFRNSGTNDQTNVLVKVVISYHDTTAYRDSAVINNWASGQYRTTNFRDFTPTRKRDYKVCIIADLLSDEDRSDDTLCTMSYCRYEADIKAVAITFPEEDATFKQTTELRVIGRFANIGVRDHYDVRARIKIIGCTDKVLRFQADSLIPEILFDSSAAFRFPSRQGSFDIRSVPAGCYNVEIISLLSDDVDRTNDTARSSFTLTPLDYNITPDSVLRPKDMSKFLTTADSITVRIKNTGLQDQASFKTYLVVKYSNGILAYRDSVEVNSLKSKESTIVAFRKTANRYGGRLYAYIYTFSPNDEWRNDDTIMTRFYWGYDYDVKAVSMSIPVANERIPKGTSFQPTAVFSWEGNFNDNNDIPVRALIHHCENGLLAFRADTILYNLVMDNNSSVTFPTKQGVYNLSTLPAGCYRIGIAAISSNDQDRTNDTIYRFFSIVDSSIVHNMVADTILSPEFKATLSPSNPISIQARFHSNGLGDLLNVPIGIFLRDQLGNIIYRDTIIENFKSMEVHDVSFSDFTLPDSVGKGVFTLYAFSLSPVDENRVDDTTKTTFFRGYTGDMALVAITVPKENEEILEGTGFNPTVSYRWIGGYVTPGNIGFHTSIYKCDSSFPVFTADTSFTPSKTIESLSFVALPTRRYGYTDIEDLEPGCYTLYINVGVSWPADTYSANDTLSTKFYIKPLSVVRDKDDPRGPILSNIYPNPEQTTASISFVLTDRSIVSIRLIDITGQSYSLMANVMLEAGQHSKTFDLRHLPEGIYLYELTFIGNGGTVQRLSKTLSIAK